MEVENGIVNISIYNPYDKKIITKPMEELVKELVACSMPLTFHIEALKCQSIIMRTAIAKKIKLFDTNVIRNLPDADISLGEFKAYIPLEDYQDLWGEQYENNIDILTKVVEDTKGIIIFFKGKPIDPRFHMACGGATENSENVDGNIVQYLRKVLCKYCKDTPYSFYYKDIKINDIQDKLDVRFIKGNPTKNMEIENIFYDIHRDEEGRIIKLKAGGKDFQGKQLMELLELNSTRFSWKPEKIRFFTSGKGDGLGLCQYGANQMALEGKLAEEIIKYYYTGVNLNKIEINDMKQPLKGKAIMIDAAHGGDRVNDNIGPSGLREKDVNLDISCYLEERLQQLGATVYMTRRKEEHIPITERAAVANNLLPNFFISIHQNHFKNPSMSGTEIYYYRGDKEAKRLGEEIIKEITEKLHTINRGIRTAEFFLLRDVKVSALHVEVGYISNPKEEELLMKEDIKKEVASGIANGITKYYGYSLK